jgi:EAL domain-containing protein (putative c-di-GMP-specific phosphodiesterase class I)/ActR/RegA family two-component response regulator
MESPLQILLVEDNLDDAELLTLELEALDRPFRVWRVETAAAMAQALDQQTWDLVLADYELPQFGAFEALALIQGRSLDVPFIVVSGSIDDTTAVQLMQLGVQDYLLKHKLRRLVPVIHRELREAQMRAERRHALCHIEYLAYHDPHTGLGNHNQLMRDLGAVINGRQPYVLAFLDLDQYRNFRYGYGYYISDQLLLAVSQRLQGILPPCATLTRVGRDDEFAILFRDMTLAQVQNREIPALHRAFERPLDLGALKPLVSWSIGLTDATLNWQDPEACLRAAEMANHQVQQGHEGGRVLVYQSPMQAQAQARSQLETELRHALRRDGLQIQYQPIVSLDTGRISGFEALTRWPHPTQGHISPNTFIPLAEQTGLIIPLGNWVFETVLTQLHQWHQHCPGQFPLSVAVNLSALHLCQADGMTHLLHRYRKAALPPGATITLEITESMLLQNTETAIAHLRACQQGGLKVSLDDFGTGYSSLSYLHRLPINTLKIDRTFVERMLTHSPDANIVRTIQTLANTLGLTVVAEGIETAEQLHALQALSCQYGQGYFLAEPMGAPEVTALLSHTRPVQLSSPSPLLFCPSPSDRTGPPARSVEITGPSGEAAARVKIDSDDARAGDTDLQGETCSCQCHSPDEPATATRCLHDFSSSG